MDDEQWELPSARGGWRVIDVVAHLAALASEAVDPPPPDPSCRRTASGTTTYASTNAVAGAMRKSSTSGGGAPRQLDLLEAAQEPPGADQAVEVPGLGTYPRHLLANTMAFNVFCHLRNDMLAPDGPLPFTLPEPTDSQVAPPSTSCSPVSPDAGTRTHRHRRWALVLDLTGPGATTVTVFLRPGRTGS